MDSPATDEPECARDPCLIAPSKEVWLDIANKGAPNVRRLCPIGVLLCFEHAKEAVIDDFLDGEIWSDVCAKLAELKLPPPTARLTKIELRDIGER